MCIYIYIHTHNSPVYVSWRMVSLVAVLPTDVWDIVGPCPPPPGLPLSSLSLLSLSLFALVLELSSIRNS